MTHYYIKIFFILYFHWGILTKADFWSGNGETLHVSEPCAFNRLCTCRSERRLLSNNLSSSDQTVNKLTEISCVQVPFSRLPSLPPGPLNSLTLVNCGHLHRLPNTSILQEVSLTSLTISRCALEQLDGNSLYASRNALNALDLSHNALTTLPVAAFRSLSSLAWINLRGNHLLRITASHLPQTATQTLRSLLAAENHISSLHGLTSLTALNSLDLDHNAIRSLAGRPLPNSLHTLSLASNLLSQWPTSAFASLSNLKWLQLRANLLKELPRTWSLASFSLDLLDLSHNLLSNLSASVFTRSGIIEKKHDSRITLYSVDSKMSTDAHTLADASDQSQNISVVLGPAQLYIKQLQLDFNMLHQIASGFLKEVNIQRLGLSNNQLEQLPDDLLLGHPIESLLALDIGHNRLSRICEFLQPLRFLQQLQARDNRISILSNGCFRKLSSQLHTLDLSGNALKSIPSNALSPLKTLKRLALERASIQQLNVGDFGIGWCKSLAQLSLSHNLITNVGKDVFKNCGNLRELRLVENPLWIQGADALISGVQTLGRKLTILQLGGIRNGECNAEMKDIQKNPLIMEQELLFYQRNQYKFYQNNNNDLINNQNSSNNNALTNIPESELSAIVQPLKGLEVLEVNQNHLTQVRGLNSLNSLLHLDLEDNHLLDFQISKLNKLRSLVLSENRIQTLLKGSFTQLPQLQHIVALGGGINQVASGSFNQLPSLIQVLLAHNSIHEIQKSAFSQLPSLRLLQLQFNQLQSFNINWFNLSDLLVRDKGFMLNDEQASHSTNPVQGTPPTVNHMQTHSTGLHLNLSHNAISKLEATLDELINPSTNLSSTNQVEVDFEVRLNLLSLDLSYNVLEQFPVSFTKLVCTNLAKLILAHNRLSVFPVEALSLCPSLQTLSLKANQINEIQAHPEIDSCCGQLQELDLSYNQIETLVPFKKIFTKMNQLRSLDLSFNLISTMHSNTFDGTSIQLLNLAHNRLHLATLNEAIASHCFGLNSSLDTLRLDANPLMQMPKTLESCSGLSMLSVRNVQLGRVNAEELSLSNILSLDLSGNKRVSFEIDAFKYLTQLRSLYLNACDLRTLPTLPCQELLHLQLRNNSITSFQAQDFAQCEKLRTLDLSTNKLIEVPRAQWKFMADLSELDISYNPIEILDSNCLSDLKQLQLVDIRGLNLKYVDSRIFYSHAQLTFIKTSTYPFVRSFRLYDLLAKMSSLQRVHIDVQEEVLSHQIQWAFGSKLKELIITGSNLKTILPDAFIGLYHTSDLTLRISHTNITQLPNGLLRFFTDTRFITLDFRHNHLKQLDASVLNLNLKDRKVEKLMNPTQIAGGLMLQNNPLICSCKLLWLRTWLRDWLKETRRTLLLNVDTYLRNHQIANELQCENVHTQEFPLFMRLVHLRPPNNSELGQKYPILQLHLKQIVCNKANSQILNWNVVFALFLYIFLSIV